MILAWVPGTAAVLAREAALEDNEYIWDRNEDRKQVLQEERKDEGKKEKMKRRKKRWREERKDEGKKKKMKGRKKK